MVDVPCTFDVALAYTFDWHSRRPSLLPIRIAGDRKFALMFA